MRSKRIFNVIDSHTAGHPTRTIFAGVPPLTGKTVLEQRDFFRDHHDELRGLLLHEPRGHAAMFGAVPVASQIADQGLFFISSYVYLDMCGHATIGYVASLAATGSLPPHFEARGMSIETPAGVIHVSGDFVDGELRSVILKNVSCYVTFAEVSVDIDEKKALTCDIAYSGITYALVNAQEFDIPFTIQQAQQWCKLGMRIKAAINSASESHNVGSILFYNEIDGGSQHLVVLADNKFDRSPCGTGTSARLAQLASRGKINKGERYRAESILGIPFYGEVLENRSLDDGREAIVPEIRGMAHISAISTLILEEDDPLRLGFLPG